MEPGFDYDCIIIGAGSAGYAAARTLASSSWKVAVIEEARRVGGLCILRGCMPTKAILHAAELRQYIREATTWGIRTDSVQIDVEQLFHRKNSLINEFAEFREQQLESGRFDFIRHSASFVDPHTISLSSGGNLRARYFILATGSTLSPLPIPGLDASEFMTSDSALELTRLPESLIVLGGGPVAVEFAQFFARMGTQVTLLQRSSHIMRSFDTDAAEALQSGLVREGLTVLTDTQLLETGASKVSKWVRFIHAGVEKQVHADAIFHGLGRQANTGSLDLEAAGIVCRPNAQILTDLSQQTSAPHIYAAGDCTGPHEIVHVAIQQGEIAAHNILQPDNIRHRDDRLLLSVVYTDPALAQVGLTEQQAIEHSIPYKAASHPFADHGKSMILGAKEGFVKILAHAETGEILGATCAGPQAGELIHELMVAMAVRMTVHTFSKLPHYHPTLAEIWSYPAEELAEMIPQKNA